MGLCLKCNKEIDDGEDFCQDCLNEVDSIEDEDYLDNLLNSVMTFSSEDSALNNPDLLSDFNEFDNFDKELDVNEDDDQISDQLEDKSLKEDDEIDPIREFDNTVLEAMGIETSTNHDIFPEEVGEDNIDDILSLLDLNTEPDVDTSLPEKNESNISVGDTNPFDEVFALDDSVEEPQEDVSNDRSNTTLGFDVSDIFANSLGAIDSLKDSEEKLPPIEKAKKESLFKKLFGNIVDDKSKKEFAEELAQEENLKNKKAVKLKKNKKDKKSNNVVPVDGDGEESENNAQTPKTKKVKEKKVKEKKPKEKKQPKNVEPADEGRVNPVGASIVFLLVIALGVTVIIGTNIFTYRTNVNSAEKHFNMQKYTKAYNEISGIDLKKKDMELFEKIRTVMLVNKELNSYNTFMENKDLVNSLDSLVKGLERYNKYLERAKSLEIKADFDYVKNDIIKALKNTFNLTEEDALKLSKVKDRQKYSDTLYNLCNSIKK